MIGYKYADLFYQDNINKQAKIEYSGGVMSNIELFQNSEELTETLCSEKDLRFGCCEASVLKFKVANIVKPLVGEWVTFSIVIDHHEEQPLLIGRYKVVSDKPTADRRHREIVAYDAMYDILNSDVVAWYNKILPNKDSKITMEQFRESFVRNFGLAEVLPKGGLANDKMAIQRTIEPENISGRDVITAICEINGCFGHIGRDGKFHYIYLVQNIQGLYPANDLFPDHAPDYLPQQQETGHLYPQDPKGINIGKGTYIQCQYEDYIVKQINKLQIRQEENDIGAIHGSGDNCYIIEDNFLVYGKGTNELSTIAKNIFNKITGIVYRPFSCQAVGNPCLEVGDPVKIKTKYDIVESYIFRRTLKGIQALRDSYQSDGAERRTENVNGVHKSIVQLKGKSNVLTRTVEETRQEMRDSDEQLSSTITQTAKEIRLEVKNADEQLSSRINQNASSITAEVTRASTAEGELSSRIQINEQGILQRVVKGNVSSEISQEAGQVAIRANRLIVESSQFSLDGSGNAAFGGTLNAASGSFSGSVNASSGTFDNVTIRESCIVAGQSITGAIQNNVQWQGSTIGGGYIGDGINGSYVGSGISGSYVTRGIVGNSRIASDLVDKTFTSNATSGDVIKIGTGQNRLSLSPSSINLYDGVRMNYVSVVNTELAGNLTVRGTKNRVSETKNYGERLLYCYEMPSPMFGDIGEGKTDETGTCMIFLDDIFSETIDCDCQYQVFLQPYGQGNCYVSERTPYHFAVKGDRFLEFGWELKAVQKGYDTIRLETMENTKTYEPGTIGELENYMNQLLYDLDKEEEII